jgi:ATP-binding cassette, subfamily B, bacterial PglK
LRTLRQVLALLTERERRRLVRLLLLTVLLALVQMVGVAAILPFMSLVGDPETIHQNGWMSQVYGSLAFASPREFLFFAGVAVLGLIAFGNALGAFTNWRLLRFSWDLQHALSVRLLDQYLHEPYSFFLNRNTAGLAKNILAEVREVINGVITPGLKMVAQSVVAIAILVLLVAVDPVVAVTAALLLGSAFGVIYLLVRRKQFRLGKLRNRMNTARFRAAHESLGGIKDTKVLGREQEFLARFSAPAREYSRANASNAAISELPRYALETLAFGGILALVLYHLALHEDFTQAIAVMSLYALAGYRLMPSLQQVFNGFAKIRFFRPALENLHAELKGGATRDDARSRAASGDGPRLPLEREIAVDGVWFRYPGRNEYVARDLSLSVPRNSTVGFVGSTGSGKTTLADIILGLLDPEEGCIRVDGHPLGPDELPAWRRNLGYVPQQIFLCDDTITRNIAFGLPDERIDHAAVERAVRIASLHDFVTSLPGGYQTVVGDRGVRLSGGQRQRIGIARALYHDPDVLIMDEATSALDGITEDAVMAAIESLAGRKTIILIAHRLSTVEGCDTIYLFDRGQVVAAGTYTELTRSSPQFRAMAKVPAVAGHEAISGRVTC